MQLPNKDEIVDAWLCIKDLVKSPDSPTEDDMCAVRRQLSGQLNCELNWLSLDWLRNEIVKLRKNGRLKRRGKA